jgi:rhomboid protease GluP
VLKRQRTGSVLCTSCGALVGVNDQTCYNCGRHNPGLWGWAPVVRALGDDLGFAPFIIGTCVVLYLLSLLLSGGGYGLLLAPSQRALLGLGASGYLPMLLFGGWWTVLSAGWLHGSALHILFNMLWVRQLGPATADVYGAGRMIIIYTVAGVTGFFLSSAAYAFLPHLPFLTGSQVTVGASASIFGLLGAAVYYGRRAGSSLASSQAWSYAVSAGALGFMLPGIDNYAHIGGFAGGYLAGRLLDPLKHERIDHVLIAIGCVAASLMSILWSAYTSLSIFR